MEPGKRYTQTVERAFHVSMACLEPNTADNDNVSVLLAFDNREFILCSLNRHKVIQTQLDLNFQSGDKIAFMSSGKGRVHLTGECHVWGEERSCVNGC
jgi:FK506-binding nuclear protein